MLAYCTDYADWSPINGFLANSLVTLVSYTYSFVYVVC